MNRFKRFLGVAALLASMSGCATMDPGFRFVKDGATQSDYDQDVRECIYDVNKHSPAYYKLEDALIVADRKWNLAVQCLEAKGYKKVYLNKQK